MPRHTSAIPRTDHPRVLPLGLSLANRGATKTLRPVSSSSHLSQAREACLVLIHACWPPRICSSGHCSFSLTALRYSVAPSGLGVGPIGEGSSLCIIGRVKPQGRPFAFPS